MFPGVKIDIRGIADLREDYVWEPPNAALLQSRGFKGRYGQARVHLLGCWVQSRYVVATKDYLNAKTITMQEFDACWPRCRLLESGLEVLSHEVQ